MPKEVAPVRRGLQEVGFVEGRDFVIEQRWAEGQYQRISGFAEMSLFAGRCTDHCRSRRYAVGTCGALQDKYDPDRVQCGSRSSRGRARVKLGAAGR